MGLRLSSSRQSLAVLSLGLFLAGCGGSSSTGGMNGSGATQLATGGATNTYALDILSSSAGEVVQFTAGANGSVSPTGTIVLPTTLDPENLAVDKNGVIYVNGLDLSTNNNTLVYSSISATTPTRSIMTPEASSIAVDGSANLYILNTGSIDVYSSTATGAQAPSRIILSSSTYLSTGYPLAIDVSSGGTVYVASADSTATIGNILVFAAGANGSVTPTLTVPLSSVPLGVAVDASGNTFVTLNNLNALSAASIVEFAAGATTSTKTITPPVTFASELAGIRVDSVGNIYAVMDTAVGSSSNLSDSFSVIAYAPSSSGAIAPTKQMSSTLLSDPGLELGIK